MKNPLFKQMKHQSYVYRQRKKICVNLIIYFAIVDTKYIIKIVIRAFLISNKSVLQYALDRYSDAWLDDEMKINTAKTKIMGLSRHPVT